MTTTHPTCVHSLLMTLFLLASAPARGGEFNPVLNPGDAAPLWKDLPGTDGRLHSLADLKSDRPVLLVFTCNSCPVARDYEERIIAFAKAHAGEVSVVAVNVNNVPEDSLEKMKERAAAMQFPYPYLYDQSQKIAKDYGAQGTPEFFLLSRADKPASNDAGGRKVLYMGAMDDNSETSRITRRYLDDAVQAALKGSPPAVAETYATGCRIRFERERRN